MTANLDQACVAKRPEVFVVRGLGKPQHQIPTHPLSKTLAIPQSRSLLSTHTSLPKARMPDIIDEAHLRSQAIRVQDSLQQTLLSTLHPLSPSSLPTLHPSLLLNQPVRQGVALYRGARGLHLRQPPNPPTSCTAPASQSTDLMSASQSTDLMYRTCICACSCAAAITRVLHVTKPGIRLLRFHCNSLSHTHIQPHAHPQRTSSGHVCS